MDEYQKSECCQGNHWAGSQRPEAKCNSETLQQKEKQMTFFYKINDAWTKKAK